MPSETDHNKKETEDKRMYKPVSSKSDFIEIEHKQLKFWDKADIFNKLRMKNSSGPRWSFLDGPITANNPMGVHHAWGRTLKDVYNRYHSMLGEKLRYQNGFDCQGLWVEVEVEKELGFKSKTDIETYGVEKFVQACKDRVLRFSAIQTEQSKRLGYWMDWNNSYYTMSDENNYTIWHFLKKVHERGWLYKGHDVMPWCTRCGAALSEHEIATEGYREMVHKTIIVKFYLKEKPDEALLVWTTTPWTLTSNTAAAVHPDLDYVKVRQGEEKYYLAKNLLSLLKGDYQILQELKGSELLGTRYHGPFDELTAQQGVDHFVIAWDEVSDSDGTGIVHIAPGCGKEDFSLSKENKIAVIAPLDEFGNYIEGFDYLTGKNVDDITPEIFANLKEKKIVYLIDQIKHRYPVCWRHGTPLVFRLVEEWFISMDKMRYEMMDVVKEINWIPAWGYEREMDWLRNMGDWMISKKRYWGLSLPIWECKSCGNIEVIGGYDELKKRTVKGWEDFEGHTPHKPQIDALEIKCSKCGTLVKRIPDVGNPWLDAGIVPFSTINYISNRKYWEQWFPADFITESLPGQFRNWFYSLLAMSTVLEKKAPFKTVLGHALVKDEKGDDMHKSAGNAIWFEDAAEKMGVDVMRWMYTAHNPENNLNFGYTVANDVRKKLLTLWNMYSFYITYADIDQFNPYLVDPDKVEYSELDRWALAKVHTFLKEAKADYDEYHAERLMRRFEELLEDISNWYVRRSRRRFWKSGNDSDKTAAYFTLHSCLHLMTSAISPIMPFVTEEIYQNLVRSVNPDAAESIHLTPFPKADEKKIDTGLLEEIDTIIRIVELGRAARNKANIRVRQPLSILQVKVRYPNQKQFVEKLAHQIKEELNIKEVRLLDDIGALVSYTVLPNLPILGKKLGKALGAVRNELAKIPVNELLKTVKEGRSIQIAGFAIEPDELIVNTQENDNIAAVEEKGYFVAIDTKISDDLKEEGLVRDLIRHIQTLRKEAGFNVDDRIELLLTGDANLLTAADKHRSYLMNETLTTHFGILSGPAEIEKELNIEQYTVNVTLRRAKGA
jgi:isoleucyl-tRNA synthetase